MPTGKKIRWSITERRQVAAGVLEIWRTDPGLSLLDAVRRAQRSLPENRRRSLTATSELALMEAEVAQLKSQKGAPTPSPVLTPPEEALDAPEEDEAIPEVPLSALGLEERVAFAFDVLKDVFLDAVRRSSQVDEKLDLIHDAILRTSLGSTREPGSIESGVKKPATIQIGLVGPLADQFAAVQRKCERFKNVKLRLVQTGGTPEFPKLDYVILWVRFLGHGWTDAAFRTFPRDRVLLNTGAVVESVSMVEAIAQGAQPQLRAVK